MSVTRYRAVRNCRFPPERVRLRTLAGTLNVRVAALQRGEHATAVGLLEQTVLCKITVDG